MYKDLLHLGVAKNLWWLIFLGVITRAGAEVVGNVRVTAISPTLVRLEQKGPHGFEDRATFTIVERGADQEVARESNNGNHVRLDYLGYSVVLPKEGASLDGAEVWAGQKLVYTFHAGQFPPSSFLPDPGAPIDAYVLADHPRIVPPPWGATPAPDGNTLFPETSGWDLGNDAPDIYVFVPGPGGYAALREDYLALTGPVPMLPLWAYGYWDSRYHRYTQQEALDSIDDYRSKDFPVDGFVVDTDWRVNGSDGYRVETKDFPDMAAFLSAAHAKNVHVMFNDHPSPVGPALSPKELAFRWAGLSGLLSLGADVWWYDRNWNTHLGEPAPGVHAEVWGERLYHDMTLAAKPERRPMIMSNVQGIDGGVRNYAPDPAGHRYPMMWTGDTQATFDSLRRGIENGVDMGALALNPYVNEDLGGHLGTPTPELYTRYLEYGAFAPIMRVHCTLGQDRHPWAFGPETEAIVRQYVKLRYRLLPTIYAAARQAYEKGVPMLRRCDLEWPQFKEAADNHEFLLGEDLLIAPVYEEAATTRPVWIPPGLWTNLWTGKFAIGPATVQVDAPLSEAPMFARSGGVIVLGPPGDYVQQHAWDDLTLELFIPSDEKGITRTLYEDDGLSNDYLAGAFRKTCLSLSKSVDQVDVRIGASQGAYSGGPNMRAWTLRLHVPRGLMVKGARRVPGPPPAMPLMGAGSGMGAEEVYEIRLPAAPVSKGAQAIFHLGSPQGRARE